MSTSSSQSRVTIQLNLTGQAATVRGLQETTSAVQELGAATKETAQSVAASAEAIVSSSEAISAGVEGMAVSSEDALAAFMAPIDAALAPVRMLMASVDALNVSVGALTSTISVSAPRMSRSLSSGLGSAKTSADGLLSSLTNIKTLLAGGFAYGSLKQLNTYNSAQVRLQTLGGLTGSQASAYSSIANAVSKSTGTSPSDVMSAAYNPVSEGFNQSASKQILSDAAMISQMGGAPLSGQSGTSYTLSTLLQNLYGGQKGGPTSKQIAGAFGLMMATVGAGDMDVSGLLAANSTGIWNTASAYGILPQTTASYLAFMSSQGVDPAEAGTRGRMAISMLASPSGPGRQIEQQLGIAPTEMLQLMHGPNGLNAATEDLLAHMNAKGMSKDQEAILLSRIFGGARTDASILAMVNHGDLLTQFDQRVGALSDPARAMAAWKTYTQSEAYQMAQLKQSFDQLEIEVGKGLLPAFKGLVTVLKPILAVGSTRIGSDVIAGLLVGATVKKVLSILAATKTGSAVSTAVKAATGAAGAGEAAAGAGEAAGGAGLAGLGAAGLLAAAPLAVGVGGLAWGIHDLLANDQKFDYGTGNKGISFTAGYQAAQALKGTNLSNLKGFSGFSAADAAAWQKMLGVPGYATGGITNGPMAIVGEGSKRWPEYVVPTDPAYRSRALALFASLGGHLLGSDPSMLIAMGPGAKAKAPGGLGASTAVTGTNAQMGQRMAAALGWTGNEWAALNALWVQESGWNNLAKNPSSGAYGIAQALPATKYPLAGQAAGGSNPAAQIAWGLQYIKQRYGDPVGAEAHEKNFGWYAKGGVLPFASYDSGGYLPEGISLAHNGTGAPEPVGHGLAGGDLTVQVVLDRKVVGEATIQHFRKKAARL